MTHVYLQREHAAGKQIRAMPPAGVLRIVTQADAPSRRPVPLAGAFAYVPQMPASPFPKPGRAAGSFTMSL